MYPFINEYSNPLRALRSRGFRSLLGLGICLLLVVLPGVAPGAALSDAQQLVVDSWRLVNQGYHDPDQLDRVHWRRLRQKALEKSISSSEDAYRAIDVMLAALDDPYTRLLRPADYSALKTSTSGNLSGVGLQLGPGEQQGQVVVISALDGSPAADADLTSGMTVVLVDQQPVSELGLEGTANALRGDVGTQVLLTVQGADGMQQELTLERRNVDLRPVRTRRLRSGSHTLGYIRITQFTEGVPDQVREALEELQAKEVEGMVLDLRNNSGGLVSSGLAIADDFLRGAPIVETRDRNGITDTIQANSGTLYDGPMLTLVNGGTASASEILAGALQDNGRSSLMGSQTFGKGLIQTLTNLSDGSGLAVTVARYVTPSGRSIQGEGIVPDRILDGPEPLNPGGEDDRWITDAKQWMDAQLEAEQSSGET